jgi:hypothetical protein
MRSRIVSLVVCLLASACGSAPPRPAPDPGASGRELFVHVFFKHAPEDGHLPGGAAVRIEGCEEPRCAAVALANGGAVLRGLPPGVLRACASLEGFAEVCGDAAGHDVELFLEPLRAPARAGVVRAEGHAVADAGGQFNALGATLFWGAWGYKFDRERLEANLAQLADSGVDYVRVAGEIFLGSDRPTDPSWSDYGDTIEGFTDLAYDKFGIRTQWTIFGGIESTPTRESRQALVDRFAELSRGRAEKIFAFEIANEFWQNGFKEAAGLEELRALGARLAAASENLVALSAPADDVCAVYAGASADAATMHYERDFKGDDVGPYHFRPIRQPWGYPSEYDAGCSGRLPHVVFNNEPIGPEASGQADDQPIDLAMGYAVTFIAQNSAYVFHAGPGIRGGGRDDLARGRHANFAELPRFAEMAGALKATKALLPPGLANWDHHNAQWGSAPFADFDAAVGAGAIIRAYASTHDNDFVIAVLGIKKPLEARPRRAASFDVLDPTTGDTINHFERGAGEGFTLDASRPAVIIRGRWQ